MTIDELLAALGSLPQGAMIPNEAQLAVMRHDVGPLWVIAGPGTGKTSAVILRCLRLLCVDLVPPDAIVFTTYTRKAARQLEHRLHVAVAALAPHFAEVGRIDVSQMRLGTLHRICWDLLTETPASKFRHLRLLDELERAFFVRTHSRICRYSRDIDSPQLRQMLAWADNPDDPAADQKLLAPSKRGRAFLTLCQRLIEDQVDRERLAQQGPHLALLNELITEYAAALRERHFTDYTFVQQQALDLLQSKEGEAVIQGDAHRAGIQHVIVDEYQDTNPLQAALYRALAGRSPHRLCVVGDDDQALFRFRGGTVTCMVRFEHECQQSWPGCTVERVQLTETYRSRPAIVHWINQYVTAYPEMKLAHARVTGKAALRPVRHEHVAGPVIWPIGGKTVKEVATNFAEVLQRLLDHGVLASPAQCALLAHSIKPTPRALGPYFDALQERGIPVAHAATSREHSLYRQVLGTLLVAMDPHENLAPPAYDRELSGYVEACRNEALRNVAKAIHRWLTTNKDAAYQTTLTDLAAYVLNVPECADVLDTDAEAAAAAHALIQTLDAYGRIVQQGNRGIPLDREHAPVQVADWWMRRIYEVLVEGLYRDREQARHDDEDLRPSLHQDALQVLTIHTAKGLEFPVVAVVVNDQHAGRIDSVHRLERAVLPFRRDLASPVNPGEILGGDDEARATQDVIRLHYVAYSRAQELLFLLVPGKCWEEPPALGLGPSQEWFRQQIPAEWPAQIVKRQTKPKQAASEGGQLALFDE